jgi:hypothetical protein
MTLGGKLTVGTYAQILAQVLTASAVVAHLVQGPAVSVWVVAPLVAAAFVPFRHDGSPKDRATGNFAAAWIVAGLFAWEAMLAGMGLLPGGPPPGSGAFVLLTLTASVLFTVAGAAFWTARDRNGS